MEDIKFSEFPKANQSKDSDEIAILQDGVNKMIPSPVLESKIINKTVTRVIQQGGASLNVINLKGVVSTYADLALITPTPELNDAYQVEADGLVYVYTENGFQADGDGFKVQPDVNGIVEEGNTQAVSGGEVYDKFSGFKNDIAIETSNLVDKSKIIKGYYTAINAYIGNDAYICIELNVSPSTTYTLYGHGSMAESATRLLYLTEDNTLISNVLSTGNSASVTFTTPSNCNRLRINIATKTGIGLNPTDNSFANNLQLNQGSVVLPYEKFGYVIDFESLKNKDKVSNYINFNDSNIVNIYPLFSQAKKVNGPSVNIVKINDELNIIGASAYNETIPIANYVGKKLYVKFIGTSITNQFTIQVIQVANGVDVSTHSITNINNTIDFTIASNTTHLRLVSNSTHANNTVILKDWYISTQPYSDYKILKREIDVDKIISEGVNAFYQSSIQGTSINPKNNIVFDLNLENIEDKSNITFYFNVFKKETAKLRIRRRLIGDTDTTIDYHFVTNDNAEDAVIWTDNYSNYRRIIFTVFNDGTSEDLIIDNVLATTEKAVRGVKAKPDEDAGFGFKNYESITEAFIKGENGYFAVGKQFFKAKSKNILSSFDYELIGDNRMPRNRKLENVIYIDTGNLVFRYIDSDYMMYFTDSINNKTYKISKQDFDANLTTPTLKSEGTNHSDGSTLVMRDEYHSSIALSNFTLLGNFLCVGIRELGNGELFILAYTTSYYTTNNKSTLNSITTPLVIGNLIDAWLFDAYDNIVVFGGYFTQGHGQGDDTRGHGRLVISTDYGKTFKVIFDADFTDLEIGDLFHIHGCCYDPYWDRVWMIVGDSSVSTTPGKIYYCDNYNDISPSWNILPFNSWVENNREQYCTIYPHADFLLLGTDMTPTALARMARVGKDVNAKRDVIFDIDDSQLTTVPSSFHQWDSNLPIAIFNGIQNGNLQNSLESCRASILLTMNGHDVFEVWKDYLKSSTNDTYNVIRYLPTHEIYSSKKDVRFASGNTMIYGKMSKWI